MGNVSKEASMGNGWRRGMGSAVGRRGSTDAPQALEPFMAPKQWSPYVCRYVFRAQGIHPFIKTGGIQAAHKDEGLWWTSGKHTHLSQQLPDTFSPPWAATPSYPRSTLLVSLLSTFSSAPWGRRAEQEGQPDPKTEWDITCHTLDPPYPTLTASTLPSCMALGERQWFFFLRYFDVDHF